MATLNLDKLDVRPDRLDLRDREYQPQLKSLPDVYPSPGAIEELLPKYKSLVLDQGQEGACTGFGLAAVINYLLWSRPWHERALQGLQDFEEIPDAKATDSVSPRMLYHLARIYDEWPGEDYDGSSCRGAMKGWHRHGVCSEAHWPFNNSVFKPPRTVNNVSWQEDAATRRLGSYFRINRESISDMQAAVYEVGAIYVSARVHEGWHLKRKNELPTIPLKGLGIGAHAFAIIGYNAEGFIVQNSWGSEKWGFHGFAVMQYRDWAEHGMDAWAAVLGAAVSPTQSVVPTEHQAERVQATFGGIAKAAEARDSGVWSSERAYRHMLVMGNDGQPLQRLVESEKAESAAKDVCLTFPAEWLKANKFRNVAIYCHGGLNSENTSLNRVRGMAQYFEKNGIYPIFVTWKTGWLETLNQILMDSLGDLPFLGPRSEGLFDDFREAMRNSIRGLGNVTIEATDRALEVACERLAKPLWAQMKQNAEAAADTGMGIDLLAKHLKKLNSEIDGLRIHLVGHSAGSLVIGHLLSELGRGTKLPVQSVSLYAAACSMAFATRHYGGAMQKGVLSGKNLHMDILDDKQERDDAVGPYRKSLLYLVSRALETRHKTPLLGLERAWGSTKAADKEEAARQWGPLGARDLKKWHEVVAKFSVSSPTAQTKPQVSNGRELIKCNHGSFDNNVVVVGGTLERILGRKPKHKVKVLDF